MHNHFLPSEPVRATIGPARSQAKKRRKTGRYLPQLESGEEARISGFMEGRDVVDVGGWRQGALSEAVEVSVIGGIPTGIDGTVFGE